MTHCQFLRLLYFPADLSSPEDFIPNLYANMQIMLTRDKYIITSQPQHRTEHILKRYFSKKKCQSISILFTLLIFRKIQKHPVKKSIIHLSSIHHPPVTSGSIFRPGYRMLISAMQHLHHTLPPAIVHKARTAFPTETIHAGTEHRNTNDKDRFTNAPSPWATNAQAVGNKCPSVRTIHEVCFSDCCRPLQTLFTKEVDPVGTYL